jgi:hypothetical protein
MMNRAINFIGFQLGWFAVVLGAASGRPWLGLVVVPLVLGLHLLIMAARPRQELTLACVCAVLGFFVDSALISGGVFTPIGSVSGWSPLWMVMLWINQAAALNGSLSWMRGRYLLGAAFGAIGGPLAYLGGAKLGAMTALPTQQGLIILGVTWGVMFPLLLWLAAKFTSSEPKR